MNPETPDQISGPGQPRPTWRTGRRLAIAGVAAVALAVGGVAVAAAATSGAPSPSSSASPSPGSSGAPDHGPRKHGPFLAGTVVSASAGTITITDFQGFQRTIHTSSSTTYEDGLTATPAVGTKIVAEGTVDSDKTSLAATRVAKLPDRPAGRGFPGGPGRGFPGPGGRHHDRDDSPSPGSSGTPSPGAPGGTSPSPSPTG